MVLPVTPETFVQASADTLPVHSCYDLVGIRTSDPRQVVGAQQHKEEPFQEYSYQHRFYEKTARVVHSAASSGID